MAATVFLLSPISRPITERCSNLTTRQPEISSRTNFAWWPKNHARV